MAPQAGLAAFGLDVIDWFSPTALGGEDLHDLRRRARLLVASSVSLSFFGVFFAVMSLRSADPSLGAAIILVFGSAVVLVNPWLMRWLGRVDVPGAALCLEVLALLGAIAATNAGLEDGSLWWMALPPLLGAFLVGPNFGFICAGVGTAEFYWMYDRVINGPGFRPRSSDWAWFDFLGASLMMAAISGAAWLYERSRATAFARLETALSEVSKVGTEMRAMNAEMAKARDRAQEDGVAKAEFISAMRQSAAEQSEALATTRGAMQRMTETVRNIGSSMRTIGDATGEAARTVSRLDEAGSQSGLSLAELVAAIEQTATSTEEMNATIKAVAANVEVLSRAADDTGASMHEMESSVAQVEQNAGSTAHLAEGVIKDAERGQSAVSLSLSGVEDIREGSRAAGELMRNLGRRIQDVGAILNVIVEVADRTNLLALNAAIIAAQAGENGRGFAVVADQIKQLAHRTAGSTKQIAELIVDVQRQSQSAVLAIERGERAVGEGIKRTQDAGEALSQIVRSAGQSTAMVKAIATATVEQANSIRQVARAMENVTQTVTEVARATAEQSRASEQIVAATERMRAVTPTAQRQSEEQNKGGARVREAIAKIERMVQKVADAQHEHSRESERILHTLEQIHAQQVSQVRSIEELEKS